MMLALRPWIPQRAGHWTGWSSPSQSVDNPAQSSKFPVGPWMGLVAQTVENPPANAGDLSSISASGSSSRERNGYPLPLFLPGEFHGQRSLVDYSPWGRKDLDRIERLTQTRRYTHTVIRPPGWLVHRTGLPQPAGKSHQGMRGDP